MQGKKRPETLVEAVRYFSDPETLLAEVVSLRWPSGIACPFCGSDRHTPVKGRPKWYCKGCKKQFSAKVNTIFEDSALTFDKWMIAIWLIATAKNGISSCEIARSLGVTQKSAWFMLHRIREAMKSGTFEKLGGKGGPEVEVDETFVGGAHRFMHKRVKIAKGLNSAPTSGKTAVMGILERGGEVRAFPVTDTKRKTLEPNVFANVKPDSWLYTDANSSYLMLGDHYRHSTVDHAYEYVDGAVHTNCMENFWCLLKRSIKGTYIHIDPRHIGSYVTEQAYRFNTRLGNDRMRFEQVVSQVEGKRLTYRELKARGY